MCISVYECACMCVYARVCDSRGKSCQDVWSQTLDICILHDFQYQFTIANILARHVYLKINFTITFQGCLNLC